MVKSNKTKKLIKMTLFAITLVFLGVKTVAAHCDAMDGPLIIEASKALESGKIEPLLKWVKAEEESEIKSLFTKTLKVRTKGKEAKEIADKYFFETLVRIHRAGEGAPFTGIKPSGGIAPVEAKSDEALEKGSIDDFAKKISAHSEKAIKERFRKALEAKKHKDESPEAGRKYVEAYVDYVHFVAGIHSAIMSGGHHNTGKKEENIKSFSAE